MYALHTHTHKHTSNYNFRPKVLTSLSELRAVSKSTAANMTDTVVKKIVRDCRLITIVQDNHQNFETQFHRLSRHRVMTNFTNSMKLHFDFFF